MSDSTETAATRGRRTFWPTVTAGLLGAALAAVSAGRTWATARASVGGTPTHAVAKGSEVAPLALALALVALAAWGAALVVRRRGRRVVAVLGLLASVGTVIAVATGAGRAKRDAVAALAGQGESASSQLTGWYFVALFAAAVAGLAFAAALRFAAVWPEMSARYDAPAREDSGAAIDQAARDVGAEPPDQLDLWKSLDEGRDPTV